jgi:hypothetical protein
MGSYLYATVIRKLESGDYDHDNHSWDTVLTKPNAVKRHLLCGDGRYYNFPEIKPRNGVHESLSLDEHTGGAMGWDHCRYVWYTPQELLAFDWDQVITESPHDIEVIGKTYRQCVPAEWFEYIQARANESAVVAIQFSVDN